MAEPVSAVVGLVVAGLHSTNLLVELTTKIRGAPKEITSLNKDVSNIARILSSLELSLNSSGVQSSIQGNAALELALKNLQQPLKDCSSVQDDLAKRLQKYIKSGSISPWNRLAWSLFRTELHDMVSSVERSKATLDAGMNVVTMLCVMNAYTDNLPSSIEKPDVSDNDAGTALRFYAESQRALTLNEPSSTLIPPSQIQPSYDITNPKSEQLQRTANQRQGLLEAARTGDDIQTEILLNEGADINSRDADGRTALHLASQNGNIDVARVLLAPHHEIDIDARSYARGDHEERKMHGHATALYLASDKGHEEIIDLLLIHHANVNLANWSNRTPLMQASKLGHTACVARLLAAGADPKIREFNDYPPLHDAAAEGRLETVRLLLDHGAEIDARLTKEFLTGYTALHLATQDRRVDCMRELVARGADVEARTGKQETAMHLAAFYGETDALRVLLDDGHADIEAQEHGRETPLHKAVHARRAGNVRYLLHKGASPYARDMFGESVIDVARKTRDEGMMDLLRLWLPKDEFASSSDSDWVTRKMNRQIL